MDIEIKKRIKTFWGCIPFAVFLLCFSLVAIVQAAPGNTLRILPRNILICFGVGCFGILLLWGNIIFSTFCGKKDKTVFVDYKTHPDLYATYSAPWYTGILVHGAAAAIVIIICLLAIRIVSNKS